MLCLPGMVAPTDAGSFSSLHNAAQRHSAGGSPLIVLSASPDYCRCPNGSPISRNFPLRHPLRVARPRSQRWPFGNLVHAHATLRGYGRDATHLQLDRVP